MSDCPIDIIGGYWYDWIIIWDDHNDNDCTIDIIGGWTIDIIMTNLIFSDADRDCNLKKSENKTRVAKLQAIKWTDDGVGC